MRRPSPFLPAVAMIAVLVGACGDQPAPTPAASELGPLPSATVTPPPSEVPFQAAAWPPTGTACGTDGYAGRLGRIEAVDRRTVRFTLCRGDAAFLTRIAHPAFAILDTATIGALAADPAAARSLAGTGPYRIDRWDQGQDAILAATATEKTPRSATPTVVVRWAADPTQRTIELQSSNVDGIDAPSAPDLDRISTEPELTVTPRAGLAVAFLAFGNDAVFDDPRVRRAFGASLDRDTLASAQFPEGTLVASHVPPCVVPGGCGGAAWYAFNGPGAAATLASVKFDLGTTYEIHVPDRPIAGLPDPAGTAQAISAALKDSVGLNSAVDVMALKDYSAAVSNGTLDGFYLGSVAPVLPDAVAYLAGAFGSNLKTTPARRAADARAAINEANTTVDPTARAAAVGRANDAIRQDAPLIPLADAGSTVAFRSDVTNVATSPLGTDDLGAFVPGDRSQLVFMQSSEPTGAYCGDQRGADAFRLCALITDPLYAYAPGGLEPQPRLAESCTPNEDASVWTCRLKAGVTYSDGAALDAGDVVASYVAQWDASQPLRKSRPDAQFPTWQALFGAPLNAPTG